ncbi:hypothetical protein KPH14_008943 [Odynerus spinipes]|uniref:Uncharacterized protein n=1 Tax=Odynerus spinipes TaxID=1348599 RepID=A0AAD9RNQ5_9HYME|nr:hypothetical protein KPH14_008943 [Odynerus spinipes]
MEPEGEGEEATEDNTGEGEETTIEGTDAPSTVIVTDGGASKANVTSKKEKDTGRKKKRKFRMDRCMRDKWTCEEDALWRVYMKAYVEKEEQLEKEDKFKHRKPAKLPKLPRVQSVEEVGTPYKCVPLNAFQLEAETTLPDKLDRSKMIRIWRNMRATSMQDSTIAGSKTESEKWPGVWPCDTRDFMGELEERERLEEMGRKDLFPCDRAPQDVRQTLSRQLKDDFAVRKELGHARIPPICPKAKKLLVDRAAGERPGLVDGDYMIFELFSKKKGIRVYADVCIRGLKGMHLIELGCLRDRQNTWKFCFYQAVIALLAKTQLRYKYAWSANIDYIYDQAWMLFTHIGAINVKDKQRLDDIIVYNYKYSVELELIQEMKDIPRITSVDWEYEEKNLRRKITLERKELMNVRLLIGSEKITDEQKGPVHKETRKIEAWFDKLLPQYRNCIFRTTKFSLAFWQDGLFWYLYNPYRCDEFGYWDDDGYACIIKFCTKQSLKRHLMILLLRAYVYEVPKSKIPVPTYEGPYQPDQEEEGEGDEDEEEEEAAEVTEGVSQVATEITEATDVTEATEGTEGTEGESQAATEAAVEGPQEATEATEATEEGPQEATETQDEGAPEEATQQGEEEAKDQEDKSEVFTIQIFQMIYHCCQIHNLKLLERKVKPATQRVKKRTIDDCPFDPLDWRDPCTIEQEESDLKDAIEKPTWLKLFKMTWAKCGPSTKKKPSAKEAAVVPRMRWHQYTVEESNKLFSLWGELHITDGMFDRENRGLQAYACYVVCAGMTRIMAPEYWSSKTLDVIVMCGDRYYTHSKLEAEFKSTKPEYSHVSCWNRYLMSHFKIGETMFEANVLPAICGRLYATRNKPLWQSLEQMFLKYHFGILTCESHCLGVFKFCGAYYMCDVNSFGPPLFQYGEGAVYLLRATYFYKFMTILILTIGSPECSQYALNPIEILKVIDVDTTGPADLPIGKPKRTDYRGRRRKIPCPYDEEKKKQMRKWKIRRAEERRTIDKTCCKDEEEG